MSKPPTREFKVLVVGDAGVGKTKFTNSIHNHEFTRTYNPTIGVDISCFSLRTSREDVTFNLWECAGKYNDLSSGYYTNARAAIILFDVSSDSSYKSIPFLYDSILQVCPYIPIILCGNKTDLDNRVVIDVQTHLPYFEISSMSNTNTKLPFQYLANQLVSFSLTF